MNQTSPAQDDNKPAPADAGKDCTVDPAPQPKAPPQPESCKALDEPPASPPRPDKPTVTCERPECCPKDPPASSTCLDQWIDDQKKLMAQAERAKTFKTELETLQQKSKAALADFTPEKQKLLLERWKAEDKEIVELIAKLVCTAPCWRQQVECFVCPLLYEIKLDLELLNGKPEKPNPPVLSLYDQRYWCQRDLAFKQAQFDRIRAVLAAWEKPATAIDGVLNENAKLLDAIKKGLGAPDAGKLIWDLFMRVVPMHLLVAPPAATARTGIDKKYVDLCKCDDGHPDDCCGPDTGVPSVLKQWLEPRPYLISPDQYDAVICCLVRSRYLPAKKLLSAAEAELQAIEDLIVRTVAGIADKKKALEANAKAKLALPFDCCKKPGADGSGDGKADGGCAPPPPPPPPAGAPCPPPPAAA